jgi:hypothetical protein
VGGTAFGALSKQNYKLLPSPFLVFDLLIYLKANENDPI